jgi:hypothetical protein
VAIDYYGRIVAEFDGYGVYEYQAATGWVNLSPANAAAVAIADGIVVGQFDGYGIIEYIPNQGWISMGTGPAGTLAVA